MEEDLDRQEAPALEDVSHLPLYRAECFSDAPELIQWVRKREPFVLSLEGAPAEAARRAAYMPQNRHVPRIEARRMALHGRFPYLTFPRQYRPEDYAAADAALEAAGAAELAGRMMDTLSGGQRQKVYLAMALAQQAPAILMDEPTTWLDPKHQLEVMATARRLAAEGRAVGLVSHELSLALRTADHVALLAGGRLAAWGTPEQVYRSGALEEAFGVKIGRMETENGWHYYYL